MVAIHRLRRLTSLPILLFYLAAPCRAQNAAAKLLTGNWNLTPTVDPSQPTSQPVATEYGGLSLTLGVDGNMIYGEGLLLVNCPKDRKGFDAFFGGQVSPDGTFTLTNAAVARDLPGGVVVIHGRLPAAGTAEWQGQFSSIWNGTNGSCLPAEGEVVAKQFPPLKGTFSGAIHADDGTESDVTMEVDQGELLPTNYPAGVPLFLHYCVPLKATMSVKNAFGPLWGIFTTGDNIYPNQCSRMAGSSFRLEFTTTDGAKLDVFGNIHNSHFPQIDRMDITIHYFPKDFAARGLSPVLATGRLSQSKQDTRGAPASSP
ncbi:hypothetical protein EDE15_4300 [Edaphobacter aggregans]|uniref:Lipocalin-like protein n=1 Tax=Edaphobacter aggregans TaxID=570835 RepID=A0A428MP76_9BACT|nr:hypothetical protein [Edaphobacter aggregans]RSL18701.1 hypothetical protein EDE15_4300 [Edaphobacter aggregans]